MSQQRVSGFPETWAGLWGSVLAGKFGKLPAGNLWKEALKIHREKFGGRAGKSRVSSSGEPDFQRLAKFVSEQMCCLVLLVADREVSADITSRKSKVASVICTSSPKAAIHSNRYVGRNLHCLVASCRSQTQT